jgi:hypothetical protein
LQTFHYPLVDNAELKATLSSSSSSLPRMLRLDMPLPDNFTARIQLWLPHDFDKSHKYPLFIDV